MAFYVNLIKFSQLPDQYFMVMTI